MEEASVIKKKKRNLPGTPDPEAEVIALSPRTLMATNRFSCDVCGKGFQRDQNLQLHRRGHNLPWKLKQREGQDIRKKVYVCPEILCIHHDPSRALGDLTGIKKHYSRKHGEKKWKCEKCSKRYAVQSDWKAHKKVCGTREYRCDCGTLFSRRDSFITHRAFCGALAEENAKEGTPKKANSEQSDGGQHEKNSPLVRTGELPSTIDAPTNPSQFTCSPPGVGIGKPPLKESFEPPLVKEVFKQASVKENFKQPPIKENFGSGLVKETFKHLPLEEALEQSKCALEESAISSVSLKMTQDDVGAQPYKPSNFFIKQPNCDMDEIGMSLISSKRILNDTGAQPDNPRKFGFKQPNCDSEENGISSLSSKWIQDGGVQSYKPTKFFKQHCALDDSGMPAVSVAPKWMEDDTGELSYKPTKDFKQPNCDLSESGIPSVSPNWIQDGRAQLDKANKGPIPLSLCLGPGPSLGALPKADRDKPFKEMNQITQVTLPENEDRNHWPLLSHDSGTRTRMLASSSSNNTEGSEPYHVLNDVRPHTDKVIVETVPYSSTNVSQSYFIGNPSKPSNNHHRYNTANGQMPATSLLQKAAMMGVTSSNPYLLRNFGLRGRNALSNMVSRGSEQDSWAGPTFSSMWHGGFTTISSTSRVHNLDQFSHESGAPAQCSLYDDRKARIQGLPKATSANVSSLSTNPDSSFDDAHRDNHMLLLGVSKVSNNSTILAGSEGLQGADKHKSDRTTLDLLGVGSFAMCMEENTISYQKIGGINSLSSM